MKEENKVKYHAMIEEAAEFGSRVPNFRTIDVLEHVEFVFYPSVVAIHGAMGRACIEAAENGVEVGLEVFHTYTGVRI